MSDQRFFFLHVMKTGGWTLRRQIMANFERDEVYPWEDLDADMLAANYDLAYLAGLPAERRARIRVYTGHFPFMAAELIGGEPTTITVLRDPVERTISFLRQRKSLHDTDDRLSLERIYEDPFLYPALIRNHQAKLFALTAADVPENYMHELEIDAGRLALAKRNLERIDVLGTQDRFDDVLAELERRFAWKRAPIRSWNVSAPGDEAPASLRRRIAEDNAADIEFYEYACELRDRRGNARMAR